MNNTRSYLAQSLALLALLIAVGTLNAGNVKLVPEGAKVFIAPMEGGLDGFIAAEIMKKKIPITVVTDEKDAEFVLTGGAIKADDKWYNTIFGGKDKNEGNVKMLSIANKQMVWAGEAGDRSLWWGNLKRGGQRKVADRLVQQMAKDLFHK